MRDANVRRWEYMVDYHIEWANYSQRIGDRESQAFHVSCGLFALRQMLRAS